MSWLDLRNAYGSVRHSLIQFALNYYHFPPEIVDFVFTYYGGLFAKVVTGEWESDQFPYDTGVFQGCTLSTILFNIVFNLLSEWLKNLTVPGFTLDEDEMREQFFADDVTIVTEGVDEHQALLDTVDAFLAWTACMEAKPAKCKSLALTTFTPGCWHRFQARNGLKYDAFDPRLTIAGKPIAFIEDKPFKHLGRQLYSVLNEARQQADTKDKLEKMLHTVDGLPLRGLFKVWVYNFAVACRLSWPLLVYDFPHTFIVELQALANAYVKKWVGMARYGTNPLILYLPKKDKGLGVVNLVSRARPRASPQVLGGSGHCAPCCMPAGESEGGQEARVATGGGAGASGARAHSRCDDGGGADVARGCWVRAAAERADAGGGLDGAQ